MRRWEGERGRVHPCVTRGVSAGARAPVPRTAPTAMATDPAQSVTLTLQPVGDGTGLVLPEAVLARLGLAPGDAVRLVATDDGLLLLPPDANGADANGADANGASDEEGDLDAATLEDARAFMRSHADAFARLAR